MYSKFIYACVSLCVPFLEGKKPRGTYECPDSQGECGMVEKEPQQTGPLIMGGQPMVNKPWS